MTEKEKRKEELLNELSVRFKDSANTMRSIAKRIQAAAAQSFEHRKRLNSGSETLRTCVESKQGPLPFSYLEFLEFNDTDEFDKYKEMPLITDEDIKDVDLDDLASKLQA